MKKLLFALVAVSMMAFTSLSTKADIKVGGGAGLGTGPFKDGAELAIQLGGIYGNADLPVNIAADFKYYLVSSGNENTSLTAWEFNANAHYYLTDNKGTNFYLLGGLQFATLSSSYDGPSSIFVPASNFSYSDTKIGLNIGAGADIDLGGITLMPQAKFTIGGLEQLFVGAFIMFDV